MARRRDAFTKQIQTARSSLEDVDRAVAKLAAALKRQKPVAEAKRTITLSPKRRAQLKLHGAYIGHLRHLKPRQRAEVKAVKAKKGYEAAIRVARTITSR